ncbi:FUSC family protein [Acidisoma sp.]|uniref:FUSC family protein n=1 Tax=Acidisoma sp. TaxID=1872115 RepID=UPI003AFFB58E
MPSPTTAYVARTLLAMAIALYAALWLQLSSPASAAVTVMIVANPSRGGIVSKGLWRVFGTITGAVAAVVIMALFPQQPILFILAFGFWLGLCTFASSMFRHFRAYAAVLSGYTVALIAAGAISSPDHVLAFALSRLAVVTLGVVTSTVVTMIFQPSVTTDAMRVRARAALRGVASLLLSRAAGNPMDDAAFTAERTRLAGEIERLDEVVEFSGVEATDVNRHAPSIRRGLAAMYAALLSVSAAGASLSRLTEPRAGPLPEDRSDAEATEARRAVAGHVVDVLQAVQRYDPQDDRAPMAMAEHLASIAREVTALQGNARTVEEEATLARVHQELQQLYETVAPFAAWRANQAPFHGLRRLRAFKDYATAVRNGTRGMIAVVLGGLFSYITAWPSGPTLLIVLASACALLSGAPSAAAASTNFAKGITLSTVIAFVWEFGVLPEISGYPLLFLTIAPILAVGIYASTIPKYSLQALGFVVFFITQLGIANEMSFNVVAYLNNGIAFSLGAWVTVLVFQVILPPNPMRDAKILTRRIRRSVERLIRSGGVHRDRLGWLVTQNQAMQRLFMRLQGNPALRSQTIGDCGALLMITQEALRLHSLLSGLNLPKAEAAEAQAALHRLCRLREPRRAANAADRASGSLLALAGRFEEPRPGVLRAAASFRTISALMPQAERFLALEAPLRGGA